MSWKLKADGREEAVIEVICYCQWNSKCWVPIVFSIVKKHVCTYIQTYIYLHCLDPKTCHKTDKHETSHITSIYKNNKNHNTHKIKSHQNIRTHLFEVTLSHNTISYI